MSAQKRYTTTGMSDEELAVLTVAENFLHGIGSRDKELMLAQILPAGGAVLMRDGSPLYTTMQGVVDRIPFDFPQEVAEIISDQPTIKVYRNIAMAWTPYEFWIGGQVHHVGVNIWSFAKMEGKWLVSSVADTSYPPE